MTLTIRSPYLGSSPILPSVARKPRSPHRDSPPLLEAVPRLLFATRRGHLVLLTVFVVIFWTVSFLNGSRFVAFEAPVPVGNKADTTAPVAPAAPAAPAMAPVILTDHATAPTDTASPAAVDPVVAVPAEITQPQETKTQPTAGLPSPWTEPVIPADSDWTRFAVVQYATNMDYLCNSLMMFEQLRAVNTKADLVLLYPDHYAPVDITNPFSKAEKLIVQARDKYGVKLHPIKVTRRTVADTTWADSYTKLLAFNLTSYDRVLSLDSDAIVLQNLDALFFSPPAVLAAPRAYWLLPQQDILSSQLLLVTPSAAEFARITSAVDAATAADYDMEIINRLYRVSALLLPHRPYNMLTAEFRRRSPAAHEGYWGAANWDAVLAYSEAKFMHFSDWPIGKPWTNPGKKVLYQHQPACVEMADGAVDCAGRDIWVSLYREFLVTRSRVCAIPLAKW